MGATVHHADAALRALLTQGVHPDAPHAPFPPHINAKYPASRERR